MTPWLLAHIVGATLLCPRADVASPDRAAADVYLAIADAALAGGDEPTAYAAVCAALEADPTSARARALEVQLTRDERAPDAALKAMHAGRWAEALELLQTAGPRRPSEAALLEGLCLLELGRLAPARAAFYRARAAVEQRELVDFYLALIDLQLGEAASASQRLESLVSTQDDRLRTLAGALRQIARADGRFSLLAAVQPGLDSNVDATPLRDEVFAASAGSADLSVLGALWARPLGRSGPYLRARGQHRAVFRVTDFTATTFEAAVGWSHVSHRLQARGEYAFEALWLAGAEYRQSHLVQLSADSFWQRLTASLLWAGRAQRFAPPELAGFSGFQHTTLAQLTWRASLALGISLGWALTHDAPATPVLAFLETGPRLGVELRPHEVVRVTASVLPGWRRYLAYDPTLGLQRQDWRLEGQILVLWTLSQYLAVQAHVAAQQAFSNTDLFAFRRVAGSLGVVFFLGVP